MTRLQTLHTLLEREQTERDAALAAFQAAQNQQAGAQAQAEQLLQYRSEYRANWSSRFAQGASMDIVRCYHGFVDRLDQAIAQQSLVLIRAQEQVQAARERLLQSERRVASVSKLITRRQLAMAQAAGRREQKALDESAQRLGALRRTQMSEMAEAALA